VRLFKTVTYSASGGESADGEGADFHVPLGVTMDDTTYEVMWAPSGCTNVPVIDLPTAEVGDRTTVTFRVTAAGDLTAGDTLVFLVLV
jgi:hypothetical protein